MLGVQEYALEKLGVRAVELKWGQGAKDIGGEVKLDTLERALQLKERGYIVLPDPQDPGVQVLHTKPVPSPNSSAIPGSVWWSMILL
jgi:hypothetical protein